MKRIAIITAFFILIALTSCSQLNFRPRNGEPGEPEINETERQISGAAPGIVVYIDGSIDPENATIDPIYEDGKINSILALCFEGLFRFGEDADGNATTELSLAESYTVEDNKVYSFTLKPDIMFYNGTAVTAEDWIWSFERLKDTSESPWATYADLIESVASPSANRLVVTLKEPRADFESVLALPCFSVQSKKLFDEAGAEAYITNTMGTGLYYIRYWNIRDRYLLYKNKYFGRQNNSNVDDVTFWVVNDPGLRYEQLNPAAACVSPPPDKLSSIESGGDYIIGTFPAAEQRYICFNVTKPPFGDPQVRRALRMATDKDEIIAKAVSGQGEKAHNAFMDSSLYFNGEIADEGFDIDRAQAVLAEAGYPDGFSCEMSYNADNEAAMKLAQILSEQWARIGVELELSSLDSGSLNERLLGLSYDIMTLRWSDETNDPAALAGFISSYDVSKGLYTGYQNPDLVNLAASAGAAADPAERGEYYRQFQQILYNDCPMFPLYKESVSIASSKHINGLKLTKLGHFNFDNSQYN